MDFIQMLILAIVQGVTEFLPISSSGHLILVPQILEYEDQGATIDIAVHVGSLLAIIAYFFKDVWGLSRGGFATLGIGKAPDERRLFLLIILGTIPAAAAGLFIKMMLDMDMFRSTDLVAANLIIFGLILGFADHYGKSVKKFEDLNVRDAILVGVAQIFALNPGTSRSGVTMSAARLLGYSRVEAARFSFLLSIPAVTGAGILIVPELVQADSSALYDAIIIASMTFIAAFATMTFLMKFLSKASMKIFALYRILLGISLFYLF